MASTRVTVGGIWHETNTFAPGITSLEDFRAYQFAEGPSIVSTYRGTRNEMGGFIDAAGRLGLELVPSLFAAAVPSGVVGRDAYGAMRRKILDALEAQRPDGVLLALHGAMVAEGEEEIEADLLSAVRRKVGPDRPVVATLDFHANISSAMVEAADALVGYDTYPHVDVYERALEAAELLARLLDGAARPVKAFRKLPLLTAPQAQSTETPPMRDLLDRMHEIERRPGILSVTVAGGFPYADVARVGLSVLVHATTDARPADACARELAQMAWERRRQFQVHAVPVEEAVRQAIESAEGPVILVDAADNIGGGAPGDGTAILAELLRRGARRAVVTITDPEAVGEAIGAGVGGTVRLSVGGKRDRLHGEPVEVRGRVRLISEGTYVHRGSYMTGQQTRMGRTVVLDCDGVGLVLMERKAMPFDAEQLRSLGIEPADLKILAVKSAVAWKAAYGAIARRVIEVDTPGIGSANLGRFAYRRIPRPIFPLDPIEVLP
jgi:microcystin degradation protein MlrC